MQKIFFCFFCQDEDVRSVHGQFWKVSLEWPLAWHLYSCTKLDPRFNANFCTLSITSSSNISFFLFFFSLTIWLAAFKHLNISRQLTYYIISLFIWCLWLLNGLQSAESAKNGSGGMGCGIRCHGEEKCANPPSPRHGHWEHSDQVGGRGKQQDTKLEFHSNEESMSSCFRTFVWLVSRISPAVNISSTTL